MPCEIQVLVHDGPPEGLGEEIASSPATRADDEAWHPTSNHSGARGSQTYQP